MNLTFDRNFSKRKPIFKILSLPDSWGNFVHKSHKDIKIHHLTLSIFLYYLVKLENHIIAADIYLFIIYLLLCI